MKNDNTGDLDFINGIRVLLCSMVFVGHFYYFLGGRYVHGIRLFGAIGPRAVDVFFFLTGFFTLLSFNNRKHKPGNFFVHRLKRLYPEYIPALLIASFSLPLRTMSQEDFLILLTGNNIGSYGLTFTRRGFPSLGSFLCYLFFSNGIWPVKIDPILDVAWCMPVEVYFYLLFSILMFLGHFSRDKNKGERICYRSAYIISLILGIIMKIEMGIDNQQNIVRSMPVMFMGIIAAEVYSQRERKKTGGILMLIIGLVYLFWLDIEQNWISTGLIMVILFMILFPERLAFVRNILSKNVFKRGGELSFSIYLSHMMVISIVFLGLMKINEYIVNIPISLMCGLALIFSVLLTVLYSYFAVKIVKYIQNTELGDRH